MITEYVSLMRFTWRRSFRKTLKILGFAQTQKLFKRHGPCDQVQQKGSNPPLTHNNRIMYLPYLVLEFFCHIFKALRGRDILYCKIFYLPWVNSRPLFLLLAFLFIRLQPILSNQFWNLLNSISLRFEMRCFIS